MGGLSHPQTIPGAGGAPMAAKRGSSPSRCRAQAGSCLAGGGQWCRAGVWGVVSPRSSQSPPGRIPEATDLGTCPQQALEPQPRSSDHPCPQPGCECMSWSGGRTRGGSGFFVGVQTAPGGGVTSSSPRMRWWGWGEQQGSQIPDPGVGTLLWATGKGQGGARASPPQRRSPSPAPAPASRARCASWTWLAASG